MSEENTITSEEFAMYRVKFKVVQKWLLETPVHTKEFDKLKDICLFYREKNREYSRQQRQLVTVSLNLSESEKTMLKHTNGILSNFFIKRKPRR